MGLGVFQIHFYQSYTRMPDNLSSEIFQGITLGIDGLESTISAFLDEYLHDRGAETIGTYRRSLNEFIRWFSHPRSDFRFRVEDIEAYKTYLMSERKLSQVSVSTYLTALRRLCDFMVATGQLPENPAKQVKGNRRPSEHTRAVLSEAEVDRLLASFDQVTQMGKRDQAIMYMMLFAGLGEIEIVRADLADLNQHDSGGWYLRVQGKGRSDKDQLVPIDPPVMDKIRLYLDTRGRIRPEEPIFVSHGHRSDGERLNTRSVRGRINHWLELAEIKRAGITPHSLTHTAALIWLRQGMTVEELKIRMRHGTFDTTMIYLRKEAGIVDIGE